MHIIFKRMHDGVWCKTNIILQNDGYENLDTFSNVSFGIFNELSGVIFSVQFFLPNVTDCQLKIS